MPLAAQLKGAGAPQLEPDSQGESREQAGPGEQATDPSLDSPDSP